MLSYAGATGRFAATVRACQVLAARSLALRTIIIQMYVNMGGAAEDDAPSCIHPTLEFSPGRLLLYCPRPPRARTGIPSTRLCVPRYVRRCLPEHFPSTGPNVHCFPMYLYCIVQNCTVYIPFRPASSINIHSTPPSFYLNLPFLSPSGQCMRNLSAPKNPCIKAYQQVFPGSCNHVHRI